MTAPAEVDTQVAMLERKLHAQQKTIDALTRRVQQQDAEGSTSLSLTRMNLELEQIVDQRTAELRTQREALANALSLWRAVTANIPDLLVQVDPDHRIVWSNRDRFAEALGRPLSALVLDPAQRERMTAHLAEAMASPAGAITAFDYVSGPVTWSCRIGAVRHRGEVIGAVLVARDVTAQLRIEGELRMATSQLLQGQKLAAIGQLAAGVAHEINTPVQFVSDNTVFAARALERMQPLFDAVLEIAARGTCDADAVVRLAAAAAEARVAKVRQQLPRAMDQSLEGLGRVSKIVSAMKDFSHPSHGAKEDVDLAAALECTATVARNEWKYVANLQIDVDPTLPRIPLLRDEFNQVVLNLIVNAVHAIADRYGATGELGVIRITAALAEGEAVVRVSDDGNGIPEGVRHRVFEPFFTTKPMGKGTGQGLAIAYAVVVEKHGGRIEIESEVGRGTTFVLHLPL